VHLNAAGFVIKPGLMFKAFKLKVRVQFTVDTRKQIQNGRSLKTCLSQFERCSPADWPLSSWRPRPG
jgi:hypothetical protein